MNKRYKNINSDGATSRQDLLLNEFMNLAISRFNWTNLPDGLTSNRLEEMLISHGQLGGFIEPNTGQFYILPMYGTGGVNIYNEHTEYYLHGYNGINYSLSSEKVCRLKNNPSRSEDVSTLELYAKRIDDVEQTQEVNLFQMCIPKIIATNTDGLLSVKNIVKKIKEFKFVVITRDKGIQSQIKKDDVLDTSAPYLLDKLSAYEDFIRNKVLTFLCLNNANTSKKERMITSEVDSNNEHIKSLLDMMFECRKEFCGDVKEKFGYSLEVELRKVEEEDGGNNLNITSND